jgi:predicted transcriptional regulator of viral defense system
MTRKRMRPHLLEMARRSGVLAAREVADAGMHTQLLSRMVCEGTLERITRGYYRLTEAPVTEHHTLAVVAKAAPRGVICLLSALSFHGIGTQLPSVVWLALDRRVRPPALTYPPLRVVRFGGAALTEGVATHEIEGQAVRVYCVAKTVADCFKYRNKVGLDVALEALREGWRERRFSMDDIDRFAGICRVERVMRPYLEALVA